jgi:peptidoglycan/xylan/chitin deacetylase (PgdA/CDA1 family)
MKAQSNNLDDSAIKPGCRLKSDSRQMPRRRFLGRTALAASALCLPAAAAAGAKKAQIVISLDLEMARNFPRWEDTHWDYEKGNLTDETKAYAVEAARRVKRHGGRIHFFLVCRALEQENVDWLKEILKQGHSIGSHTYDHVYLLATKPEEIQYRFQRAPWLIAGKTCAEVIRENIKLATAAMKSRLGISPMGFRAPGGFADGLTNRPDIQTILLEAGFSWVSTKYPAHPNSQPGFEPSDEVLEGIVKAQTAARPFAYPSGLVEIPMSPISDIGAFRNGRWNLDQFLRSTRMNLEWVIRQGAVFDFLSHPAVLSATDPNFHAIDLICETVESFAAKAEFATLDDIFQRWQK